MSRIQNSLKKALEDREMRNGVSSQPAAQAETAGPGTQELWQEVHRLENSLANWNAHHHVSPSPAQLSSSALRSAEPVSGSPAAAAGQEQTNGPAQAWKETLKQCESQLSAYDEQMVRRLEEQTSLDAQVASQEQMVAQASTALTALRHRLTETQRAVKSVEAEKASVQRKLDALRECQRLSDASAAAEQELRATSEMITQILDYQQRVADKLAQYQQHRQTAQHTAEGLRRQLQQAVARVESGTYGETAHE